MQETNFSVTMVYWWHGSVLKVSLFGWQTFPDL